MLSAANKAKYIKEKEAKEHSRLKAQNKCPKPKKQSWYEQWRFYQTWKDGKVSTAFIEKLIDKLVAWVDETEDHINIGSFHAQCGLNDEWVARWRKEHSRLDDAYKQILVILADRREIGMQKFQLHYQATAFTQHHYCKRWSDSGKYHAKLKAITEEQDAPKFVVIKDFPKEEDKNGK